MNLTKESACDHCAIADVLTRVSIRDPEWNHDLWLCDECHVELERQFAEIDRDEQNVLPAMLKGFA